MTVYSPANRCGTEVENEIAIADKKTSLHTSKKVTFGVRRLQSFRAAKNVI